MHGAFLCEEMVFSYYVYKTIATILILFNDVKM